MEVLKSYLNNKIDILHSNIENISDNKNLFNNKLFEKKIEYMNNYLHNCIVEVEEINNFINDDLFNDSEFINKKLNDYKLIETSIDDYVVHNL